MPDEGRVIALYEDGDTPRLTESEHADLLRQLVDWFQAADAKRQPHKDEWRRDYLLYRGYVPARKEGDYSSRVFIPVSFHVIETEMPKLIAQLPTPIVLPVGPEDVEGAAKMEERLSWAFDQSGMFVQLVAAYRSALKYGTGILKITPGKRVGWIPEVQPQTATEMQMVPTQVPTLDPATGEPMLDIDGAPLMDTVDVQTEVDVETDQTQMMRREFTFYQGPIAEAIDIEDLWPAPEATSIEDARYVIHQVWRDEADIHEKFDQGIYRLPEGMSLGSLWEGEEDTPALRRQGELGLGSAPDPTRRAVKVWEVWVKDGFFTVLNERIVARVAPTPFAHGMKPFVRILDHYQEHEFWGVGELGPIRGIQDIINALWNSRIDNVRLVLQRVFAVNPDNLYDMRDLRLRPGGAIRIKGGIGMNPSDLIAPIDFPDITSSAYEEVQQLLDLVEKVTGVSSYTAGVDSPTMNRTATGVALITEQGNTRFALKVRMAELTGIVPLARMYGALLQQFGEPEVWIRREGADGGFEFGGQGVDPMTGAPLPPQPSTAQEIMGAFDYDIEAASATQTESLRKEQELSLWSLLAGATDAFGMPLFNDRERAKDLLRAFGKKDIDRLMAPEMGVGPMMGPMGPMPTMGMPGSVEEGAEMGMGY